MVKRSGLYVAVALACLLATNNAVAQKKYDPGATDIEIKIGQNAPFSGPASSYSILSRVQSAYLKAINERGGINGRKITLLSRDDGYSPPKSLELIRQLVEDDHFPFFFFALAIGAAGLNPGLSEQLFAHGISRFPALCRSAAGRAEAHERALAVSLPFLPTPAVSPPPAEPTSRSCPVRSNLQLRDRRRYRR